MTQARVTIIAALIAVAGSIVVALIPYWTRDPPPRPPYEPSSTPLRTTTTPPPPPPPPPPPSVINIAGDWFDPKNPSNGSRITQVGNRYSFTGSGALNGIQFTSNGNGEINGQYITGSYITRYQNGYVATGMCSGTLSPDGSSINQTCADNVLGTFPLSAMRR